MTPARASCPQHGTITCTLDDITLTVHAITGERHYSFPCEPCQGRVILPADPALIRFLLRFGISPIILTDEPEILPVNELGPDQEAEIARFAEVLDGLYTLPEDEQEPDP